MERVGILLIGISALIYVLSTSYVDISYMLMDKAAWDQIP
jgi:hypothetical protein